MENAQLLVMMIATHFLADYIYQPDFIAKFKGRHTEPPPGLEGIWFYALTAHCTMHAVMIGFLTNFWLGVCEFVVHWICDFGKCEGWYGLHIDQMIHVISRIIWWTIFIGAFSG